jgi:hypothetical protein
MEMSLSSARITVSREETLVLFSRRPSAMMLTLTHVTEMLSSHSIFLTGNVCLVILDWECLTEYSESIIFEEETS